MPTKLHRSVENAFKFISLGLCAGFFILSCSDPNAIAIPVGAKSSAPKSPDADVRINQSGTGEADAESSSGVPSGSPTGESVGVVPPAQTDPFASGEVNSETLLALASLSSANVAQLSSEDVSTSIQSSRCGFIASDADIIHRLIGKVEGAGWSVPQQGNLFTRASPSEVITFQNCRCLVRQLADQRGVLLVPVNSQ
ncbi:MAG: hypothetical protein FJY29_13690 [Betaproteobacteria bacterium]|nr:hypothetical protein [Betaproteobacteria bacterium]